MATPIPLQFTEFTQLLYAAAGNNKPKKNGFQCQNENLQMEAFQDGCTAKKNQLCRCNTNLNRQAFA